MAKPYKIVVKAIIFDHQERVLIMRKSKRRERSKLHMVMISQVVDWKRMSH